MLLNRECLEALQEILPQLLSAAHATPVAMHHNDVVRSSSTSNQVALLLFEMLRGTARTIFM